MHKPCLLVELESYLRLIVCLHLLNNMFYVPLLVLKGLDHYWTLFSRGLKQMEVSKSAAMLLPRRSVPFRAAGEFQVRPGEVLL